MTATRELIRLIRSKPVAHADLGKAALLALDAAANFLAGVNSDPGRRLIAWAGQIGLISAWAEGRADPGRLAFLLGGLCHILEVDDLHRASVVHPGCVVAPVIWAQAAASPEPVDGRLALKALLHGFEATTRLGMAVGAEHYRIWHNTATCGPFGSAMAAACLLGLDEEACVNALGNAGTQAAGLWEFLDTGAMSKHLHAGRGAEAGYLAAQLAQHGFTGAPAILEGQRGFFAAMCRDGDVRALAQDPDAPWQAHLTSIKPWPSCRHTHPAVDAAQELRDGLRARSIRLQRVARVTIESYDAALALCDRPQPDSLYAAKFSLQHCVSAALARDEVWFDAFGAVEREALAGLRSRCEVQASAALNAAYPQAWGANIRVTLDDGSVLAAWRSQAKGDPELPLSTEEMKAKARRLLDHAGVAQPDRFIDAVLRMALGGTVPQLPIVLSSRDAGPARAKSASAHPA